MHSKARKRARLAPVLLEPDPESSVVIGFRLRSDEVGKLKKELPNIVEDNSHHLIARKLCRDFIDGKLIYLGRRDRLSSRQTA